MVRVLRKSIDFENDLARKYPMEDLLAAAASVEAPKRSASLKYPEVLDSKPARPVPSEDKQFAPCFKGIISACFDAYLGTWVQHEHDQLMDALNRMTAPGSDRVVEQDDDRFE